MVDPLDFEKDYTEEEFKALSKEDAVRLLEYLMFKASNKILEKAAKNDQKSTKN